MERVPRQAAALPPLVPQSEATRSDIYKIKETYKMLDLRKRWATLMPRAYLSRTAFLVALGAMLLGTIVTGLFVAWLVVEDFRRKCATDSQGSRT